MPHCNELLENVYRNAGMEIEVYVKPGGDHHPHGLEQPEKVVDFILRKNEISS